jgi:hypothetical protein
MFFYGRRDIQNVLWAGYNMLYQSFVHQQLYSHICGTHTLTHARIYSEDIG